MRVDILMSCMNVEDVHSLLKRSNILNNVIVVNQKLNLFKNEIFKNGNITIINSGSKGLSKSRNIALNNSTAEVCLLSDDDERFVDDYQDRILEAVNQYKEFDVFIFEVKGLNKKYPTRVKKMKLIDLLKVSSVQIAFKRESILKHNVVFDEKMGAGTGHGGGEENKFLISLYKNGAKIIYIPVLISELLDSDSCWFSGFTEDYFYNKSWSIRRILGPYLGSVYLLYFLVSKRSLYINNISMNKALKSVCRGFFSKR